MKKLYISFITMLFISSLSTLVKAQEPNYSSTLYIECSQLDKNSEVIPPDSDCLFNSEDIESKLNEIYANPTINLDINVIVSNYDCTYSDQDGNIYGPEVEPTKNMWFKNNCTDYLIIVEPNNLEINTKDGEKIDISQSIDVAYTQFLKGSLYNVANYNKIICALNYILEQKGGCDLYEYHDPAEKVNPELYSLFNDQIGSKYYFSNSAENNASANQLFSSLSNLGYLYVPAISYTPSYYNYTSINQNEYQFFDRYIGIFKGNDSKLNDFVFGHSIIDDVTKINLPYQFKYHHVKRGSPSFSPINHFNRISKEDKNELYNIGKENHKELSPIMFSYKMEHHLSELLTANNGSFPSDEGSSYCNYNLTVYNHSNDYMQGSTSMNIEDHAELQYCTDSLENSQLLVNGTNYTVQLDQIKISNEVFIFDGAGLSSESQAHLKRSVNEKNNTMQNTVSVLIDGQKAFKTKFFITSEESKTRFTEQNSISDYDILFSKFDSYDFDANPKVISTVLFHINWPQKQVTFYEKFNGKLVTEKSLPINLTKKDSDEFNAYLAMMIASVHTGKSPSKHTTYQVNTNDVQWGIIGDVTIWDRLSIYSTLHWELSTSGSIPEGYYFSASECNNCPLKRLRIPKVFAGISNGITEELSGIIQMICMVVKLINEEYKNPGTIKKVIKNFTFKTLIEDYNPCYANTQNCTPKSKLLYWRPKQVIAWAILIAKIFFAAPTAITKLKGAVKSTNNVVKGIDNILPEAETIKKATKEIQESTTELSDGPTKDNLANFSLVPDQHQPIMSVCQKNYKAVASIAKLISMEHVAELVSIGDLYKNISLAKGGTHVKLPNSDKLVTVEQFIEVSKELAKIVTYGPVSNKLKKPRLQYFYERAFGGNNAFPKDKFSIEQFHELCYQYPKLAKQVTSLNRFKLLHIYQTIQTNKIDIGDINFEEFISIFSNNKGAISDATINKLSKIHFGDKETKKAVKHLIRGYGKAVYYNKDFSGSLHDWVLSKDYFKKIFISPTTLKSIEHSFLGKCWESGFRNMIRDPATNWLKNRQEVFKALGRKKMTLDDVKNYVGFSNLPIEVEIDGKIFRPEPDLVFIKLKKDGSIDDILILDNKLKDKTELTKAQKALKKALNTNTGSIKIAKGTLKKKEYFLDTKAFSKNQMDGINDNLIIKSTNNELPKFSFFKTYLFDKDPKIPDTGIPRNSEISLKDSKVKFTPKGDEYTLSASKGTKIAKYENLIN